MNDTVIGYLAMLVAALGFGSNFLPVKKCETGNGIAFQFFFCWAVWLLGLGVGWYRGFPSTPPIALLGGALWCTGNLLSVPAIKLIGLGMSLLLWGITNMLIGWASGTFGLLGVTAQAVANPAMNYAGMGLAVVALLVYLFVKPVDAAAASAAASAASSRRGRRTYSKDGIGGGVHSLQSSLLIEEEGLAPLSVSPTGAARDEHGADVFLPSLTGTKRFGLGVGTALAAGLFFGTSFNPSYYIMDHATAPGSSLAQYQDLEMIDFVSAHFNGIFLTSSCYFLVHLLTHYWLSYRRSTSGPYAPPPTPAALYPASLLPAFASGLLWAVAMVAWFVANGSLQSLAVTFPIITSTPGLVASLWGVLVFKEIQGKRNLLTLGGAFLLTLTSCLLIAFSM